MSSELLKLRIDGFAVSQALTKSGWERPRRRVRCADHPKRSAQRTLQSYGVIYKPMTPYGLILDKPDIKAKMRFRVPALAALHQDLGPMLVSEFELLQPHALAERQ